MYIISSLLGRTYNPGLALYKHVNPSIRACVFLCVLLFREAFLIKYILKNCKGTWHHSKQIYAFVTTLVEPDHEIGRKTSPFSAKACTGQCFQDKLSWNPTCWCNNNPSNILSFAWPMFFQIKCGFHQQAVYLGDEDTWYCWIMSDLE